MGIFHFAAEALGLTREQRNRIVALYRARTHWVPAYYREVTEVGVTREPRQVPITVSLTSFPARIKEIHRTVNTLLTQTVKPDRVILWLGEEKFPNKEADLPKKLLRMRDFGLTIRWTRDIRSYTKLLPALKAYPNDIVITADDDIFYNPDMVERLYRSYLSDPTCIHAQTVLRVTVDADGRISPYNSWKYGTVPGDKSFLNHLEGVGGVLYPPHSLSDEVFNEEAYLKLTPTVDDIWFWSMAILNNVKVCDAWGGGVPPFQYNPRANGTSSLWSVNIDPSVGNDRQFADLLQHYPAIGTRLKSLKG